ncbi:YktB family protein [Paenibacillus sp. GCM10012306]|uniref:YktB family protein n=1 Tax=Paenibacillus sp. GCM10012306 TaxID=3317342 RepID=UPI003612A66F
MPFTGFTEEDFDVFHIPGLEPRMDALIARVRPKLTDLGSELVPVLSALCGEEMFPHVAKHARRTVHAPNDTWVAWGPNKRGYKALPHFQVGMFHSHLFVVFAIIYESSNKTVFAEALNRHRKAIRQQLPGNYFWSTDHLDPRGTLQAEMGDKQYDELARKLKEVKKAEVTCGLRIDRDDPILSDGDKLLHVIQETFETLLPLYRYSF